MTMTLEKVLYAAKAHTTGGRDGASRSSDGRLDIRADPSQNRWAARTSPAPIRSRYSPLVGRPVAVRTNHEQVRTSDASQGEAITERHCHDIASREQ
jgi:hypothetical protein